MTGVPKNKVVLEPYNEQWADEFEKTKQAFLQAYGDTVVDIQHVGSTSIKGIVAKPILDMAVVFRNRTSRAWEIMKSMGYVYYGEVASGRHLFILRGEKGCSLQHVHCYEERNLALFYEQIRFRDYLCAHPEAAEEYASLKTVLCRMYANDRRKYTEGKQAFFDKIKRLAAAPHGGAEGSDSSSDGEAEPSARRPNMLL